MRQYTPPILVETDALPGASGTLFSHKRQGSAQASWHLTGVQKAKLPIFPTWTAALPRCYTAPQRCQSDTQREGECSSLLNRKGTSSRRAGSQAEESLAIFGTTISTHPVHSVTLLLPRFFWFRFQGRGVATGHSDTLF